MNDKFATFSLGIVLVAFGAMVIVNPRFYSPVYNYHFDFTGYNIPFGIALIVAGILYIWTALRKKKE